MAGKHTETLNTPVFRGGFMNVFEPKALKQIDKATGKPKTGWQITMLFKDGEKLEELKAAAMRVMVAEFGEDQSKWPKKRSDKNPNGWRVPWRDQSEKDADSPDAGDKTYDGYKAGNLFCNATSYEYSAKGTQNKPPFVVDENVHDVIDKSQIYSGAYYIANVNLYWYDNESKGIGMSFNGIQKIEDGEPLGGNRVTAAQVFSPIKADKSKVASNVFDDDEDPMA